MMVYYMDYGVHIDKFLVGICAKLGPFMVLGDYQYLLIMKPQIIDNYRYR
jgi:hypothetical protein